MIKLETIEGAKIPSFATTGSAGLDFYAFESVVIKPMQRLKVRLGTRIKSMPHGIYLDLRIRSGISINYGITLINGGAVIDSDYKDELMALIVNLGDKEYTINAGDKIVQGLFINTVSDIKINEMVCDRMNVTSERQGGFGSTGK